MWEHPLHFPLAAWTALTVWGDRLWQELIGILGWPRCESVAIPPWRISRQSRSGEPAILEGCQYPCPILAREHPERRAERSEKHRGSRAVSCACFGARRSQKR